MITKKRLKIPIFEYFIDVVIFDNWTDLYNILDEDIYKEGSSRGITVNYSNRSLVCIGRKHYSTLVHEAGHLVNAIWRYIGYEPQRDNDEPSQYLLTYIFERIEEVWQKHKNNTN
jgi:hypothetical protein